MCLIQFYTITKEELSHIKPLYKFVTFKSIVFLTWWQGVAIALLYSLHLFRGPVAQALQFKSSIQDFIICIEMGIASMVHLYVFPAKPYKLMAECFSGAVSVLGYYVSAECRIDPDEVRDSERPTKLRLPQPDIDDARSGMNIKESVRDVVIGGGEYKSGACVIYLGAASGTTVSHVSDLVGPTGVVYAVEFSHRSGRDLVNMAKKRTNVIPIIEDARHPENYFVGKNFALQMKLLWVMSAYLSLLLVIQRSSKSLFIVIQI